VVFASFQFGTLDVGYNPTDQWAALARVGFSFFAGVLLFRFSGTVERRSGVVAWACVAAVAAVLAFRPSEDFTPYFELGAILVGFPILVWVANLYEPGPISGRVFSFIGLMSYAVYILHQPLGSLARVASARLGWAPEGWIGWFTGPAFLTILVAMAWQIDKRFDAPIRGWLRARLMPAPKPKVELTQAS
jgi:peptidoglycan/LPS O-acetylase OafA/YrhL